MSAVRSGGPSPLPGAASIAGGVVVDLSLLNQVLPSQDELTVDIGAGAKWGTVSRLLDGKSMSCFCTIPSIIE